MKRGRKGGNGKSPLRNETGRKNQPLVKTGIVSAVFESQNKVPITKGDTATLQRRKGRSSTTWPKQTHRIEARGIMCPGLCCAEGHPSPLSRGHVYTLSTVLSKASRLPKTRGTRQIKGSEGLLDESVPRGPGLEPRPEGHY